MNIFILRIYVLFVYFDVVSDEQGRAGKWSESLFMNINFDVKRTHNDVDIKGNK